jgi:hypothetical protein
MRSAAGTAAGRDGRRARADAPRGPALPRRRTRHVLSARGWVAAGRLMIRRRASCAHVMSSEPTRG